MAPRLANWAPTATSRPLSTARSRPLRLVSNRVLAAATARDRATHSSTVSGTAITAATAEAAPSTTATAAPTTTRNVSSGPTPTSEDTRSARISGRGRSGSMASRVGSRVSSPPKTNNGMTAQPTPSRTATPMAAEGA